MKREIEIGTTATGQHVTIDVDVLLRSGLIVQANSGGGKSWALRRLAEQLSTHVPVFVVDVEGEFASLRERFPFFLAAKEGGDTTADPRSAGPLARELLGLRVSAVFDLFDLDLPDRHAWMAAFLRSLDQAPRDLWGDTAILVDEAHVFAPERGKGESSALNGMAALATRGRKRGFGPIDATQRMGKFNKDVAAELKNAMVGWTNLDIDRERALEALGVGRKDKADYDRQLRSMEPGEFFVVGRAFGTFEPVKIRVGTVHSSHPEPGQSKHVAAPPPPAKIRAILAKLGDLLKEQPADVDASGGAGAIAAREQVATLQREVNDLRIRAAAPRIPQEVLEKIHLASENARQTQETFGRLVDLLDGLTEDVRVAVGHTGAVPALAHGSSNGTTPPVFMPGKLTPEAREQARSMPPGNVVRSDSSDSGDGAARMLRALAARHPTPLTEQQVAVLAGMSRKGGTYRTYRGKLTGGGLVVKDGDFLRITEAGLKSAGPASRPTSARDLLAVWRDRFTGKARDLLELMAANGGAAISKADALGRIGLDPAGGTARTYWGQLSGCGLIERAPGGFRAIESLRL